MERDIVNFKPPSLRRLETVIKPYEMVMRPKFLGLENIPDDRPLLFVSNHTIMGFDFPLLLAGLYRKKGIFLRVLADHSHFQIPVNADILQNVLGAVDGTRRNTELLMSSFNQFFIIELVFSLVICFLYGLCDAQKKASVSLYTLAAPAKPLNAQPTKSMN